MAKKLDSAIADVLKRYGFGPEACWDCHGTWVVYHRALEQIAAKAGIEFAPPLVLEADGAKKSAALCVTGTLGDKAEWSVGEAAPHNNKNAYPFAMAEKRAKDRVILKLIGLHGLAYSEEEADDFKYAQGGRTPADMTPQADQRMADNIGKYTGQGAADPVKAWGQAEWKEWFRNFKKMVDACTTAKAVNELVAKNERLAECKSVSVKMYEAAMDYAIGREQVLNTPTDDRALLHETDAG